MAPPWWSTLEGVVLMPTRFVSKRVVSLEDRAGLALALARLADKGQLRLDPAACDARTIRRLMAALQDALDDQSLHATQALLATVEARRRTDPARIPRSPS